jgi:hypothetical protein
MHTLAKETPMPELRPITTKTTLASSTSRTCNQLSKNTPPSTM